MSHHFVIILLAAAALTARAQDTPWVTETTGEFFSTVPAAAGRPERLIVTDRETGVVRVAQRLGTGDLDWSVVRPSGLAAVAAVAVGTLSPDRPLEIALTAPEANRVTLVPANATDEVRHRFFTSLTGPGTLTALDSILPGADPAALELFVASERNDGAAPHRLALTIASAGTVATSSTTPAAPWRAGHSFRLERTGPEVAGFRSGTTLSAWRADASPLADSLSATDVPAGAQWVADFFNPLLNRSGLLFYVPGEATLGFRQIVSGGGSGFSFSAPMTFTPGGVIDAVIVVANGSTRWLLLLGGGTARLYEFDGLTAPGLRQSFAAPPGETFTAGVGSAGGDLFLLSGVLDRSERWQRQAFNGTSHSLAGSGVLPGVPLASSRGSHVFAFSEDPFLFPSTAVLFGVGRAPDWTTAHLGGLSVTAENDRGPAAGLGNPASLTATLTPGGGFPVVVNQLAADCSLFSYAGRETAALPSVVLDPPPGQYAASVTVTASLTHPGGTGTTAGQLRYQINDGPWLPLGTPVVLNATSIISVWGSAGSGGGTMVSPLAGGLYTIAPAGVPAVLPCEDRNRNGICDVWENLCGDDLSADSDGDTFTNGQEYAAGTDPCDPLSVPSGPLDPGQPALFLTGVDPPPASLLYFRLTGKPGIRHAVQSSTSLSAGQWSDFISGFTMPASGFHDFTAPYAPGSRWFFRGVTR